MNYLDIVTAQSELRQSYMHGGPGTVVSGIIWLIAGISVGVFGVPVGFVVLFFGGMLIFPITTLIVRGFLRRAAPAKENPGGITVVETIFPMIGGLFCAWLILPHRPDLVFPIAAIAVGSHYFGFRTAYGDTTFWVLGSAMCLTGVAGVFVAAPTVTTVPYVIAAIEIAFGLWLVWVDSSQQSQVDKDGEDSVGQGTEAGRKSP